MKLQRFIISVLLLAALCVSGLAAQSLKGMSLNGATGLYSIPSGRVGWEQSSPLGLDLGYHAVITKRAATHIPKASLSLFKLVELSAAFDVQPEKINDVNESDFIGGAKIELPIKKTAIAIGGNYQVLNMGSDSSYRHRAGQVYLAITFSGNFFDWPAETTAVFGKTFRQYHLNSDIDFGMGFDMVLAPKVFGNLLHWVIDFANFSYSTDAYGADPWARGVLNTGFRFDLSVISGLSKFKCVIDVLMADAFDSSRAFSVGAVFGIPIL